MGRPPGSASAPSPQIANQIIACSPSRENTAIARSRGGVCPRVRNARRSARSRAPTALKLEADFVLLGVEPDVDDLGEVERELGVLCLQLMPALAALRQLLAQVLVGRVGHPHRQ